MTATSHDRPRAPRTPSWRGRVRAGDRGGGSRAVPTTSRRGCGLRPAPPPRSRRRRRSGPRRDPDERSTTCGRARFARFLSFLPLAQNAHEFRLTRPSAGGIASPTSCYAAACSGCFHWGGCLAPLMVPAECPGSPMLRFQLPIRLYPRVSRHRFNLLSGLLETTRRWPTGLKGAKLLIRFAPNDPGGCADVLRPRTWLLDARHGVSHRRVQAPGRVRAQE